MIEWFKGIIAKLVSLYGLIDQLYKAGLKALKIGESILSKIALSGVSVSCLTGAGFFALLYKGVNSLITAMQSVNSSLSNASAGVGSSSILSKVNFYFPIDVLCTIVLLLISIWVACSTFKFYCRLLGLVMGVRSSHRKD